VRRPATREDILWLQSIAAYQWDWQVARALFSLGAEYVVDVRRGVIRHVIVEGRVYITRRPNDGLLSPSLKAGERIRQATEPPRFRVVTRKDIGELRGGVLVKDVVEIDPDLRPGDEVIIVGRDDVLLGVGRLRVPPPMLDGLFRGEVVRVRSKVKA